ncbi:hypothetical protein JRO89_XS06G0002300 [Xanthoceras sorbifolium]|uniref:Uncharacterized protein n=1 Tax=Xanthoceras sorbifolium TaxID=99658 RepID=A0ABQ8HVW3_9ROSI|nr:hypothetical protein JRO89_XS06G0002300 [Xanthoceras sorbifolium]
MKSIDRFYQILDGVHGAPELVQGKNAKVKKPYEQRRVLGLDMCKEYVRLAVSNLENTIALPLWYDISYAYAYDNFAYVCWTDF